MMKVLLLTTHLNIGGVAVYTINLARSLKAKGVHVYVASSGGTLVKMVEECGIKHTLLNINTKCEFNPKLLGAFVQLRTFIARNNIDIIHAHTRVTQILANALSATTPAAYVSTCHGFFKHRRLSRRFLGAWGNYCIAISDAVRGHLLKDFRVKNDRIFLIYTGVDTEKFSRGKSKDDDRSLREDLGFARSPVVGSISRLSPVKGLRYLLFAMKDILKKEPTCHLLLVGEGPSKEFLMELSKRLGIENNVFFAQNTTETERFLSIIDVFVFYSLEEGLGLSLLEALASGKPCVASNVGGVTSIIDDGVTGVLVPPKDPHALAEAILRVLGNKDLRSSISKEGNKMVSKRFTLSRMTDEVYAVYEKALRK